MFIPHGDNSIITPEQVGEELFDEDDYVIQAYDPGGTTGWCMIAIHKMAIRKPDILILPNVTWWTAGELTGSERSQVGRMTEGANLWPRAHLVMEDFILRKLSADRALLAPVRVAARFEERMGDRHIVYQLSSFAMTAVTDERLRDWGFWVSGSPHARDAIRHALLWAQRAKKIVQSRVRSR